MLSFFAFIPAVPLSRTCLLYLNVEQLERVKHQLLLDPVVHSSFGPGLHPFLTPAPPPTYFSLFQAHILRSQPHKCFVRTFRHPPGVAENICEIQQSTRYFSMCRPERLLTNFQSCPVSFIPYRIPRKTPHPLDRFSKLDYSTARRVSFLEKEVPLEISGRELCQNVSFRIATVLAAEEPS